MGKGVLVATNRRSRIEKGVVWYGGLRMTTMVGHTGEELENAAGAVALVVAQVFGS